MTELAVDWLDVFTDRPFAGNPLAVVPDADDLTGAQMQTLAAELGLSETAFVLGGTERLRIFAPTAELPLAGHPTVGATLDLVRRGRIPEQGQHVFTTGAGRTPVEVAGGVATMTQAAFDPGVELDPGAMAALLRIDPDEVVGCPRACSTIGPLQAFVRLPDRATLARLEPDMPAIAAFGDVIGVAAWCEHDGELAQRFFAPALGIPEDPATGAAAGALAALRVLDGGDPGAVTVRQGDEIGRPSEIRVSVGGSPGAPYAPRVGGRAVLVVEGALRVEIP